MSPEAPNYWGHQHVPPFPALEVISSKAREVGSCDAGSWVCTGIMAACYSMTHFCLCFMYLGVGFLFFLKLDVFRPEDVGQSKSLPSNMKALGSPPSVF